MTKSTVVRGECALQAMRRAVCASQTGRQQAQVSKEIGCQEWSVRMCVLVYIVAQLLSNTRINVLVLATGAVPPLPHVHKHTSPAAATHS